MRKSSLLPAISARSAFRLFVCSAPIKKSRRLAPPRFQFTRFFSAALSAQPKSSSGNDAWGDEEQQLLRLHGHVCPAEEVSDNRQAAHDRHFGNVRLLLRNDDAANDHRAAVGNRHLR